MKDRTYMYCILALPLFAVIAILYHTGLVIPTKIMPICFFHHLTGFSCPGCGCTRAAEALIGGHILKSLYYNPVVLYAVVIYVCYVLSNTLERLIYLTQKKLPSPSGEGSPIQILKKIHGMKKRPIYLYIAIYIMIGYGLIRFFVELSERI